MEASVGPFCWPCLLGVHKQRVECLGAPGHLLGLHSSAMVLGLGFDPLELGLKGRKVRAPNNDLQQVWDEVIQRLSLHHWVGDDLALRKLAASLLPMLEFLAKLRQAGTADWVAEVARLRVQNLRGVTMPPSCELSPEFQPTVVTCLTHHR